MKSRVLGGSVILLLAATFSGCTKAQTASESASYAILDQLSAASGATPTLFAGQLASDVLTLVKQTTNGKQVDVPTIFEDPARATMHLGLRDPGTTEKPTEPSPANTITFTRYHVTYIRADGRNVPGVDVPYPFDGGLTTSLVGGNVSIAQLTIVRASAKEEAPLRALRGGGGEGFINTIAQITFYGSDTAGRAVSVTGNIGVNFADWGDPQ
jgi:hypothetical protein